MSPHRVVLSLCSNRYDACANILLQCRSMAHACEHWESHITVADVTFHSIDSAQKVAATTRDTFVSELSITIHVPPVTAELATLNVAIWDATSALAYNALCLACAISATAILRERIEPVVRALRCAQQQDEWLWNANNALEIALRRRGCCACDASNWLYDLRTA